MLFPWGVNFRGIWGGGKGPLRFQRQMFFTNTIYIPSFFFFAREGLTTSHARVGTCSLFCWLVYLGGGCFQNYPVERCQTLRSTWRFTQGQLEDSPRVNLRIHPGQLEDSPRSTWRFTQVNLKIHPGSTWRFTQGQLEDSPRVNLKIHPGSTWGFTQGQLEDSPRVNLRIHPGQLEDSPRVNLKIHPGCAWLVANKVTL